MRIFEKLSGSLVINPWNVYLVAVITRIGKEVLVILFRNSSEDHIPSYANSVNLTLKRDLIPNQRFW